MKIHQSIYILALVSTLSFACSPKPVQMSRTEKNNNSHTPGVEQSTTKHKKYMDESAYSINRTILEASVDGATETIVDQQMDKQAEALQMDLEDATIQRIGNGIHLSFSSDQFFGHDSRTLSIEAINQLKQMALIVKKYNNNDLMIEAHTDALGDNNYNLELTKKRADVIKDYFITQGIDATRIYTRGCGETQPIADNKEQGGQALNRRIDIGIFPSADIKEAILSGDIK